MTYGGSILFPTVIALYLGGPALWFAVVIAAIVVGILALIVAQL